MLAVWAREHGFAGALVARRADSAVAIARVSIRVLRLAGGPMEVRVAGALAIRVGYTIVVAGGRIRILAARASERGFAAAGPIRLQGA